MRAWNYHKRDNQLDSCFPPISSDDLSRVCLTDDPAVTMPKYPKSNNQRKQKRRTRYGGRWTEYDMMTHHISYECRNECRISDISNQFSQISQDLRCGDPKKPDSLVP